MNDIEKLIDYINEQIEDACKYAKCAVNHKTVDAKLGDLYYTLSKEELNHAHMEEEHIERLLNEDKESNHEWQRMIWNWQRGRLIDRKSNINAMLTMYKE